VPRRNHDRRQSRRSSEPPGRERRSRPPTANVDEEALALREAGESYSAIARRLELARAATAHAAFIRAVRHRSGSELEGLLQRENERLDQLEARIRERDAADPEKVTRRLAGVEALRGAVR
jgi:hypothetical protein